MHNIFGAIRQTSGSESGLIRKSGFESRISFGWGWTPWRRFALSEHSLFFVQVSSANLHRICSDQVNSSKGKKGKGAYSSSWTSPQNYDTPLVKWDHTVLSAIRQRWPPRLHPNRAGWYSIYRPHKDERLSWPSWLITVAFKWTSVNYTSSTQL